MVFQKNKYLCDMKKLIAIVILLIVVASNGCNKYPINPNYPNAYVDITINLNDYQYYDLRFDGGYMYLTPEIYPNSSQPETNSRGIIVYRVIDEFRAYDRLPPNYPNACTDSEGNTIRLVVESPYVVDHCNNAYYNILNGNIIVDELHGMVPTFSTDTIVYPLIQYETTFDGVTLRIRNSF